MKVIKILYDDDKKKKAIRKEQYDSIEKYILSELSDPQYSGQIENIDAKLEYLQKAFARLVDKISDRLKFTPNDIVEIVGDYIDDDESLIFKKNINNE